MRKVGALLLVLAIISGCKKTNEYPLIPSITFKSLTTTQDASGYDLGSHVIVTFTDGDGDIGYHNSGNGYPYDDTSSIYYYNFVVKLQQKKVGIWNTDTFKLSGRIPYLTPEGNNKALKGDIGMDIPLIKHVTNDTMRYEIFIYDRALHKSNVITTDEIVITTH